MSPSAGQDLYSRLILGMSKELSFVAHWKLSSLLDPATPPGVPPLRWRPLPPAAGCRRQGGGHGAILGLVPPRLLSAREEGCLMQRPHRPGWSSGLVLSATRSKLGPPFFGRRPQYAYLEYL